MFVIVPYDDFIEQLLNIILWFYYI
jgi:hypothetical protein